jgi:hypothetical protein
MAAAVRQKLGGKFVTPGLHVTRHTSEAVTRHTSEAWHLHVSGARVEAIRIERT